MKLLFYDKFFDSLIDLPRGIQKKVVDFQKKFRENSKSSGIHLEPISTFKDKSLRSARVDQTYRAIIKAPDAGDIYYLLWVDHHDKAYDWAMNKVFQWNDETQSMQMFSAPEVIEAFEETKTYTAQKDTFFSGFKTEQLLKIGVPEILLPSVRKLNSIDELEEIEKFIPTDVFENLFYLLDGADIKQLIFEIEEGKVKEKEIEAKVNSINNQRNFIELTDDNLFNEVLSGSLNKWKYYLHPSQRKLIKSSFSGSVKVSGGAGTGKTVAALHRLKYISEIKEESEKILFTTFTKALTKNLGHLVEGLGIDKTNLTISNIDEVIYLLVEEHEILPKDLKVFEYSSVKAGLEIFEDILSSELTTYSPEFLESEFLDVILYHNVDSLETYNRTSRVGRGKPISRRQRKEIWGYFEKFIEIKKEKNLFYKDELSNALFNYLQIKETKLFDYCLVDELQDFSNIELRVIRSLVAEKPNDLFMVGDPMQKIYDKKINFTQAGINIRGKKSSRLRINYRTTEEIKKLALSVIKDCHYDNFDGEEENKAGYVSLFHGKKPSYQLFRSKNNEVDFVMDEIKELIAADYQLEDIAICSRTKDGLKDFRNALHQGGIDFSDNSDNKTKGSGAISLLTFHKVKGLEFKIVFLVDVNNRSLPKLPYTFSDMDEIWQKNYLKNEKSLVYVAISRAIENVYISGVGTKSEIVRL